MSPINYIVADAEKRGELCILNVPEINSSIWIQALYHPHKLLTPQMKAFFSLLQEYDFQESITQK